MKTKDLIIKRREAWDASHPFFGGMETSRNLRERLHTYAIVVKHEEATPYMTMDEICMKMAPINREVAEVWDEIQKRHTEEIDIARHEVTPEELRLTTGKKIHDELEDADLEHQMDKASTFDVDDGSGPSDSSLQNKVAKELQRKIGIRPAIKVRVQKRDKNTVYNPAVYDPDPYTRDPSRNVTGMADLQCELEAAVRRLLPADNATIAAAVREELARIEASGKGKTWIQIYCEGAIVEEK